MPEFVSQRSIWQEEVLNLQRTDWYTSPIFHHFANYDIVQSIAAAYPSIYTIPELDYKITLASN